MQSLTLSGLVVLTSVQRKVCVNNSFWLTFKHNICPEDSTKKRQVLFRANCKKKESSQVESVWRAIKAVCVHYNCAQAWAPSPVEARRPVTVNTRDIVPHLANLEAPFYKSWISVINIVNFYLTCIFYYSKDTFVEIWNKFGSYVSCLRTYPN